MLLLIVEMVKYIGFYVYHRPYKLRSPVIVFSLAFTDYLKSSTALHEASCLRRRSYPHFLSRPGRGSAGSPKRFAHLSHLLSLPPDTRMYDAIRKKTDRTKYIPGTALSKTMGVLSTRPRAMAVLSWRPYRTSVYPSRF